MTSRATRDAGSGPEARGLALLAAVATVTALAAALPAGAQGGAGVDGPGWADAVERSDRHYVRGRAASSLHALGGVLEAPGPPYPVLWRAARASVALALLSRDVPTQRRRLRDGIRHGRRAVRADSAGVCGRYWLAAGAGLLAIRIPAEERVADLGRVAHDQALWILEGRPDHAGAHNVLGRVHFEVMQLPAWKRWLGGLLGVGDFIDGASWEGAERHLRAAVRGAPAMIYYRLDLARLLAVRDRGPEARGELEAIVDMPIRHPPDPALKDRARALLDSLPAATGRPFAPRARGLAPGGGREAGPSRTSGAASPEGGGCG